MGKKPLNENQVKSLRKLVKDKSVYFTRMGEDCEGVSDSVKN